MNATASKAEHGQASNQDGILLIQLANLLASLQAPIVISCGRWHWGVAWLASVSQL